MLTPMRLDCGFRMACRHPAMLACSKPRPTSDEPLESRGTSDACAAPSHTTQAMAHHAVLLLLLSTYRVGCDGLRRGSRTKASGVTLRVGSPSPTRGTERQE